MTEQTFLRLQPSEAVVCHMASRLLAAQLAAGAVNADNESAVLERCAQLALSLARRIDRAVESDDESGER